MNRETRSLVFERQMPHPSEKIWRALTKPWLIKEWLMKDDFVAEVGRRFTFAQRRSPDGQESSTAKSWP